MFSSAPRDVLVLDSTSLTLARFGRGSGYPLTRVAGTAVAEETFAVAPVTPGLGAPDTLTEAVRRLRSEAGGFDRAWVLLPDSWFRLNLIDVDDLPSKRSEAEEIVRWSLRRTLPIPADTLRVGWTTLSREGARRRLLVVSAIEETLDRIERALRSAGVETAGIEPVGLNVWNSIVEREAPSSGERLFLHVRTGEFTTAVFRGTEPIFIRSRNLSGERSVTNEMRLSASYLRESVQLGEFETCYLAGNELDPSIPNLVRELFGVEPVMVRLDDYVTRTGPGGALRVESELIAARGVFAA